jgi:hypothetical protein
LAKVLNFNSAVSPKSQGEKPTDNDADAETQMNEAESVDSREEPQEGGTVEENGETEIEQEGDLPGATLSDADRMLHAVYGDYVHQNPGQHLNGGIDDDQKWQDYWQWLIVYPSLMYYDAPSGVVGRCFVEKLAKLINGIQTCKLNAENFIVFQIFILQHSCDVKQAKDIQK